MDGLLLGRRGSLRDPPSKATLTSTRIPRKPWKLLGGAVNGRKSDLIRQWNELPAPQAAQPRTDKEKANLENKVVKGDLHRVWLRSWMSGSIFSLKAILPRVGASLLKNSSKPPCYYRVLWPRVNFSLQDQSNRIERDSFGTAHMLGCCSVHI